ncbi:putative disease resistance protein [Quercus suber]|uniref:Disease resistance protein n=1 Tax=Quercus suber TaxID=58331 RepID=A0AAW0L6E1_QUESU
MLEDLVINSVGCFLCLKSLTIASSNSSLRPGGGCAAHSDLLPNLEELHLQDMTYLESISEIVGHLGLRFQKLKLIEVTRCSQMKYLISCGHFILTLPNLEVVKVSFCDKLDELFSYHSRQKMYPDPVAPSLRILELKNLPKLRTLCRHEETCNRHLEAPNLIPPNLQLPSIYTDPIISPSQMWDISSIDQLPNYMQICYRALLSVFEVADEELAKQGTSYRASYAKDAKRMKLLAWANFDEAKWVFQNYISTMEEYMNLALRNSTYPMVTTE